MSLSALPFPVAVEQVGGSGSSPEMGSDTPLSRNNREYGKFRINPIPCPLRPAGGRPASLFWKSSRWRRDGVRFLYMGRETRFTTARGIVMCGAKDFPTFPDRKSASDLSHNPVSDRFTVISSGLDEQIRLFDMQDGLGKVLQSDPRYEFRWRYRSFTPDSIWWKSGCSGRRNGLEWSKPVGGAFEKQTILWYMWRFPQWMRLRFPKECCRSTNRAFFRRLCLFVSTNLFLITMTVLPNIGASAR